MLEAPALPPSFVEGLGRWLGWTDAIALAAALPRPAAAGSSAARTPPSNPAAASAGREFARVRAALARAIADDGAAAAERRHPGAAADTDAIDFAPHRERCIALQQAMQGAIGPLRAQAREAVARLSGELHRLAAIDAVMDGVLSTREQALLAMLPALLQKHFDRLRREPPAPPGPWLDRFRQDMRRLLLAELDLRLQPVQGLLEAAAQHATRVP